MMDRKFSDPTTYDISIDWDDAPDGSDGGYDRHGNRVIPSAMMELIELRAQLDAEREKVRVLREALEYAVKQVPEMGTVPGVKAALATTEPEDA